jgi:hypothetical protein
MVRAYFRKLGCFNGCGPRFVEETWAAALPSEAGFWSIEDRPNELSAQGDPLEQLRRIVDFKLFR